MGSVYHIVVEGTPAPMALFEVTEGLLTVTYYHLSKAEYEERGKPAHKVVKSEDVPSAVYKYALDPHWPWSYTHIRGIPEAGLPSPLPVPMVPRLELIAGLTPVIAVGAVVAAQELKRTRIIG